jgi:hypothetical protein
MVPGKAARKLRTDSALFSLIAEFPPYRLAAPRREARDASLGQISAIPFGARLNEGRFCKNYKRRFVAASRLPIFSPP